MAEGGREPVRSEFRVIDSVRMTAGMSNCGRYAPVAHSKYVLAAARVAMGTAHD
jgi:hypothetical protein